MFKKEDTILHFVGIGGIGMSGIAEVFLNQGYKVVGSDLVESESTRRLAELGAKIFIGHRSENVQGAHVVVVSSAVKATNPEVLAAKSALIPVIPRAEMLAELMRGRVGIAVAGTHGKTTTTSMLATILTHAGLDPTLVIGGKVDSLGGNAKLGSGNYLVAEADESDGSFLQLPATFGIITNIDNDHLDHYGSLSAIEEAFVKFVGKLPFYGVAVICGEDAGVKRCMDRWTKPFLTYGFSADWDIYATDVSCGGFGSKFQVFHRVAAQKGLKKSEHELLGEVLLSVPGKHNVLNALACIAIALQLEIPFSSIVLGLKQFRGVKRRFDLRWKDSKNSRAIVDDYGHHPVEITATLEAARSYWPGRIITVFQPHRYSRTLHCKDGFLTAFLLSDVVLVTDIYGAGEDPIPGVDSSSLVGEMKKTARPGQEIFYVGDLSGAKSHVAGIFKENDLVLCLGAGSITRLPDQLIPHEIEK
ncbi:MAG: UDP-N-acetylmuramate--L-alanine ligase [Bdellovibrio sp.]|nr:UDP-N-acetylmuramate--L-alanine ligase [Bdellovibrio sp.]